MIYEHSPGCPPPRAPWWALDTEWKHILKFCTSFSTAKEARENTLKKNTLEPSSPKRHIQVLIPADMALLGKRVSADMIIWYKVILDCTSWVMPVVKNPPTNVGDARNSGSNLGWEDPLGEEMATHLCSCLRNPITEEPGGLQSMVLQSQTLLIDPAHTRLRGGAEGPVEEQCVQ